MDLNRYILKIAQKAQKAAQQLSVCSTEDKNQALRLMAQALVDQQSYLLKENQKDLIAATEQKLSKALIDRLTLNEKRIKEMADGLLDAAQLSDPVGEITKVVERPNGLVIQKIRTPIGVVGIIYESRPNVTSDCIGLCLKSGNAVILKGGKEAFYSNLAIFKVLSKALSKTRIPSDALHLIASTERRAVNILLGLDQYVDVIIPRGGESLINFVVNNSRIPVIKHYKGVCHIYVSEHADIAMARKICFNAKVQKPGVCNAMETLLVNEKIAQEFLPLMLKDFIEVGVEIRGCAQTRKIVKEKIKKAKEQDWYEEYLDLVLSVKVVKSLNEAIGHIHRYGTKHSDAIITEDKQEAEEFLHAVDSACVYVNASTRFTDGYQFGMGAEIGISTDKLHARGPMALEELTSYKYLIYGNGQIRQ